MTNRPRKKSGETTPVTIDSSNIKYLVVINEATTESNI